LSDSPSISVVIPAYNAARFLGEALASALTQDLPPTQVIVVDDGSTDGTGDIAKSFGDAIQFVRRENGGIGAARNTGLQRCTGEMLAFLDADDVWPVDRLARLAERLVANPEADAAFGQVVEFGEDIEDSLPQEGALASSMLIRRSSFERVGPFREDIRVGEYIDWYARAKDAGLKFVQISEVVLRRRLHETNTGRLQRDARPDYVRVLREALHRRREAGRSG
jgi:glycosyltransferase involved in cell wall biosynthesis